jgi:hypothetical protein
MGYETSVHSGFGGTWNVIGSLKGFFLFVSITSSFNAFVMTPDYIEM